MATAIPTSERRVSNVGIALLDEDGNFEAVEIDEADEEIDDEESRDTPMPLQESQNSSSKLKKALIENNLWRE
ncbi:hypothetical protein Ciccas_008544 [Cichlidogyrus casuarinus]|uniref:Uncharacterized protein n=1 Tax=Cichlidogyrus casuarinus TaxID=1844966 RepID=A0ABD2PZK9_9PLAT